MAKPEAAPAVLYTAIKKLPKTFAEMVKEHRECTDMIKVLKARQNELKEILIPAMIISKHKDIEVPWKDDDDNLIRGVSHLCSGTTARKIDAQILMSKYAVPSDHIVGATIGGKKYDYITVTVGGEAVEVVES